MSPEEASITADGVRAWIHRYADEVASHRAELVKLDTAIGDGDHGTNMDRGFHKAAEKLDSAPGDDIGAALKTVGMALVSSVGGAAGPLYGTLFLQMGTAATGPLYGTLFLQMGTASTGRKQLDLPGWTAALEAAMAGVQSRGKAQPGDKTMVDALVPAVEALRAATAEGAELGDALRRSADAAESGMQATIEMEARRGRASYLGPRSVGHQDPGATSTHLLLRSAAEALGGGAA